MAQIIITVPDEILRRGVSPSDVFEFLSGRVTQNLLPNEVVKFRIEPFISDNGLFDV